MKIVNKENIETNIKQSNKLIESSHNLSLVERRIFFHILGVINPLEPQQTFKLKVNDFLADFPNMDRNSVYAQIKEAGEKLWQREIILSKTKNKLDKIRLVSRQIYEDNQGTIEFTFTNEVMPLIFDLKSHFTTMILERFSELNSVYSLKLYELLCHANGMKKTKLSLSLEELRYYFNCTDTYSDWKDLKKWVIDPAIEEVSKKTDLSVTATFDRNGGRKISSIIFYFLDKNVGNVIDLLPEIIPKRPRLKKHPNPKNYYDKEDEKSFFEKEYLVDCFSWAIINLKTLKKYEEKSNKTPLSKKDLERKEKYTREIANVYSTFREKCWDSSILEDIRDRL